VTVSPAIAGRGSASGRNVIYTTVLEKNAVEDVVAVAIRTSVVQFVGKMNAVRTPATVYRIPSVTIVAVIQVEVVGRRFVTTVGANPHFQLFNSDFSTRRVYVRLNAIFTIYSNTSDTTTTILQTKRYPTTIVAVSRPVCPVARLYKVSRVAKKRMGIAISRIAQCLSMTV
jgi:hypothetical protein